MFSYEFFAGGVVYDTLERIHRGEVDDWVDALESSGLFDVSTVLEMEHQWRQHPKSLLDLLLLDADEMTQRRCAISWAALDRLAPIAQLG
ncbi:hypothetical protein FOS14_21940 [Skermania sp. ID1734]|nr:hypothetical protein [Skermania sp. ID1734]TSD93966.1 hypothetical protein FOS14_21940 [Skermania sp. ID1734]